MSDLASLLQMQYHVFNRNDDDDDDDDDDGDDDNYNLRTSTHFI
jgi:hypothetical protein